MRKFGVSRDGYKRALTRARQIRGAVYLRCGEKPPMITLATCFTGHRCDARLVPTPWSEHNQTVIAGTRRKRRK